MAATLEVESTLTDRYQTTVPETVRRALKLGKRDKIHYAIRKNGEVVIMRALAEQSDPALKPFLQFLAQDIASHPARLQLVNTALATRISALVGNAGIDLNAPLSAADE